MYLHIAHRINVPLWLYSSCSVMLDLQEQLLKPKCHKTSTFESTYEQPTHMWNITLKPFVAAEEDYFNRIYRLKWCHWLSWIVGKRPVMKNSPLVQHHTLLTLLDFVINTWNQNRIQQNNTCHPFYHFFPFQRCTQITHNALRDIPGGSLAAVGVIL